MKIEIAQLIQFIIDRKKDMSSDENYTKNPNTVCRISICDTLLAKLTEIMMKSTATTLMATTVDDLDIINYLTEQESQIKLEGTNNFIKRAELAYFKSVILNHFADCFSCKVNGDSVDVVFDDRKQLLYRADKS